jgi:hypothetical protein
MSMANDALTPNDKVVPQGQPAAPAEPLVTQLSPKDHDVLKVPAAGTPIQADGTISFGDAHKTDHLYTASASPELQSQLSKATTSATELPAGTPLLAPHAGYKLTEYEGSGLFMGKQHDISAQYPAVKEFNDRAQKEIYGPAQEHYSKAVGDLDRNWPNHDKLEAERKQYQAEQAAYQADKGHWGINGPPKPHMGPEMQKFAAECEKIKTAQDAATKFAENELKQNMEKNTPGFKDQERKLYMRQLGKELSV